jgi:hypothetical protein
LGWRGRALGAGLAALGTLAVLACSTTNGAAGGDSDGGGADGACGPLPESFSVSALPDCVAAVPNPCCPGFHAFACAGGDGGGNQCSETTSCVRASRYDQSLCAGAEAYSCPDVNGTNFATMTAPSCEQMEAVGPAGEGIRWCCGSNLPPAGSLDAASPPPVTDDATAPPMKDATAPVKDATPPPTPDATPPPTPDASKPVPDAAPSDANAE